jgi:hypothetical protein
MKRPAFTLNTLLSGLGALALTSGAMADGHEKELLWEREGVDFTDDQKLYLKPLNLDDVKILKPAWFSPSSKVNARSERNTRRSALKTTRKIWNRPSAPGASVSGSTCW